MVRAILQKGVIVPLEPLPADWREGIVVEVAIADDARIDIDAWAQEMNLLCAESSEDDERQMRQTIQGHRQLAKEPTPHEMG